MRPTKKDLLLALGQQRYPVPTTQQVTTLRKAEYVAKDAMQKFLDSSATYKKLKAEVDRVTEARYKAESEERVAYEKEIAACRQAIYIEGPTEANIAQVNKLLGRTTE